MTPCATCFGTVTIRDGNHRTFGAFLAGERYVYVKVIRQYSDDAVEDHLD